MKYLLLIAAMSARMAFAQTLPPEQDCNFVSWWANKAFHISHTIGLEEDKWTIVEDGFPPEVYAVIIKIKEEAYHDMDALRRWVEAACEPPRVCRRLHFLRGWSHEDIKQAVFQRSSRAVRANGAGTPA